MSFYSTSEYAEFVAKQDRMKKDLELDVEKYLHIGFRCQKCKAEICWEIDHEPLVQCRCGGSWDSVFIDKDFLRGYAKKQEETR